MSCTLRFPSSNVAEALSKITGSNDRLYASYLGRVLENDNLSKEFIDWYKSKHPNAAEVSTDATPGVARNIAKGIVEFYNLRVPDGRMTIRNKDDVKSARYTSVADRNLCKRVCCGMILRGYNKYHNVIHKNGVLETRADYEKFLEQSVRNTVIKWIAKKTKKDINEIKQNYLKLYKTGKKVDAYQYLESLTKDVDLSIQEQNQLALIHEILTDGENYFNELFKNSTLASLTIKQTDDTSEEEKAAMNNEAAETSKDDDLDVEYFDDSFRVFDSHDGIYKTFEIHVSGNLRNYFNGLTKLRSVVVQEKKVKVNGREEVKTIYDEDTSNNAGMPDTMNAGQCMVVMYTSGNFTNIDNMIESVRRIASTQPGMEAFVKFADDLEANRDFAYEVYRTFSKMIIAKTETVLEGNEMKVRITNKTSDKLESLRMQFLNSSRDNSVSIDGSRINKKLDEIVKRVNEFKQDDKLYNKKDKLKRDAQLTGIVKDLTEALKYYYPSLDESAVLNYVYGNAVNDRINEAENIIRLVSIGRITISGASKTLGNFRAKQRETAIARSNNDKLKQAAIEESEATGKRIYVDKSKLIDIPSIWAISYVSKETEQAALQLAKELVKYSTVKVELNVRNVEGNLSSCVINSNFLTNFINEISSELNTPENLNSPLAKFGNWKLGDKQYNLSNILVEERDEYNGIINYGLFKKNPNGTNYIPTEYARYLLQITLFDGASDRNQGKNVLYSKMSTGDYIATAMSAFFNDSRKAEKGNIPFASYFMRTPSDAPRNYLISAPVYRTSNNTAKEFNLFRPDGTINRRHKVFKQYRRLVKQELSNATRALEFMFKTVNGVVALDENNRPILNPDTIGNNKNPLFNLFKNYHYKGDIIKEVKKDGISYYVLTGNVFEPNKLTYVDDNGKVHNFIKDLIGEDSSDTSVPINFLYGGAMGKPLILDDNGDVIISNELQEAIDSKIEEFLKSLVDDGYKRIMRYESLLKNVPHTREDIQDFVINYHLMYNNFDDLFEGDCKFYKSSQDFLKRAKEVQGSGVPYANEEGEGFGDIYNPSRNQINIATSILERPEFKTIREGFHDMHLYDKFRAVTVKNTIKQEEVTKANGILSKQLQEAGLTKEEANAMMKGYEDTTVNDAQSYITVEEWIRRVTLRGQAYQYKDLIEALLDESKPLNAEQIKQFIQVQKNFYYDQHKDPITGLIHPRQIKNAEFVLVPRFIKDTELEQVYNAMIECGIDQLNTEETSKAGKARVLTLWDDNGVLDKKAIDTFKEEASQIGAIELFDYKHLYTQQETPQHVNAENKAAIQIMKKILDNIDDNSSPKLKALKEQFTNAFCANIEDSYEELCSELGIELDKDGNITYDSNGNIKGLDRTKLGDKFVEELNRLGANSQLYDFVEPEGEIGLPKMPPYLNSIYYKLQNISQAIFNNGITRQKLPGFHASQITQIGFRPFSEKVNKREYSSTLQYHPNGEPYIEIMLPKANFGLSHLSDEEALEQLKKAEADSIIGYRIPTEGKQSICVMKVVGFTDDALGSTIVVPDGWVAQTGSDFDIDSIYGINWETYLDKKGNLHKISDETSDREHYNNYVLNKLREISPSDIESIRDKTDREQNDITAEEAHETFESDIDFYAKKNGLDSFEEFKKGKLRKRKRAARNNQILNSMIGILQDPSMLEENLSRSNSDDLENAVKDILPKTIKDKRDGRSAYNFLDQADYQSDAISGRDLKGFSVTRDTLCSICNQTHAFIDEKDAIFIVYKDGKKFKHQALGWSDKGSYGNTMPNKNIVGKLITCYSSQTTAFNLDVIKKGAIPNVNNLTFSIFKLFPDLGSSYDVAVSFIVQPGITRIVDAYHKGNSIYSQDSKKPIDEAIMGIARDLGYKEEKITFKKALDFINSKKEFIAKVNKYLGRENKEISGRPEDIEHTFINEKLLLDRINEAGDFIRPVEEISENQLAFDLATILTYNKLSVLAGQITSTAMVLNPDKFGAKQTIYATRKVFDDIVDIIANDRCPLKVMVNGQSISILEAVYPGIVTTTEDGSKISDIDSFLTTSHKSIYPTLYTFLKRATAPSIKVNQTLFKTQSDFFVDRVKSISSVFSGNSTKITEDLYDDVERFYLNYIYNSCQTLRCPTDYIIGTGFANRAYDTLEEEEIAAEQERSRLFGFNRDATLSIEETDEVGETYVKQFEVADINNPKEDELRDFAKLSPAQKVAWVQQHFRDSIVCEYFNVDLSNRVGNYNRQTVRYIENNVDIEVVFQDFLDTFNNDNPLLAMTAMDLIKYAFVVEGYRMSKGAVNKTLHNNVLLNEIGLEGSGIINQLVEKMAKPELTLDDKTVDKLITRYVRAHSTMKEISHTYISKNDRKYFRPLGQAVYFVTDIDTIVRKNLGYLEYNTVLKREIPTFNKFITINEGKVNNLFRIVPVGESCILYPLNKLDANETTEWSANMDNNIFPSEDFYKRVIDEQFSVGFVAERFVQALKETIEENPQYKVNKPTSKKGEITPNFDINDARTYSDKTKYPNSVKQAIEIIDEHFASGTTDTFYFNNAGLRDIIKEKNKGFNKEGGTIQTIKGKKYHIYNAMYKPEGSKRASEHIAVEPIGDIDIKTFGSSIEEQTPTTLEDLASISHAKIMREDSQQRTDTTKTYSGQARRKGVKTNTKSVEENMGTVISSIAQYVTSKTEELLNGEHGINKFDRNPETGELVSIDDESLHDKLRSNPSFRRDFIRTILEAKRIINDYTPYDEFDVSSEDAAMDINLKKIKESVKKLRDNKNLKNAEMTYVNEYLKKITKNPLIKEDILEILDGYHSTSAIEAWIHDLQETGSPLLQVVTKDVMANIRAREMEAQEQVRKFDKAYKDIEREAKAKGHHIDLDKIIDDHGRIVREYNDQLDKDLKELQTKVTEAKELYKGDGTEEDMKRYLDYLKAQLELDKFILQNFNQKLPDSYYAEKIALEENMITKYPAVYARYKALTEELYDILSHTINGELDPAYEARRVEVNRKIQNLKSNVIIYPDGSFKLKSEVTKSNPTDEELANSITSATALNNFTKAMRDLNSNYYEYTDNFAFEELLEHNLDIIRTCESEARLGRTDLRTNEQYIKAKQWMHDNTIYAYDFKTGASLNAMSKAALEDIINEDTDEDDKDKLALKAQAAVRWLFMDKTGTIPETRLTTSFARANDAYDETGTIDARKFTEEQRAAIKKEQEDRAKAKNQGILDENAIISSLPPTNTIYTKEFWQKVSTHGLTNIEYLKVVKDINDILRKAYDKETGVLRTSLLSEDDIHDVLELMKKLGYKDQEFNYKDKNRIKRKKGVSREESKESKEFIKAYCEDNPNMAAFTAEETAAMERGNAYYIRWSELNYEWVEQDDGIYKKVPNRLLWGGIKLKDSAPKEIKEKYIDVTRTNAMRVLNRFYTTKPTKYYYDALNEYSHKSKEEYNDWYEKNHIYNTFTHTYEPIECWMERVPNDEFPGHYEASFNAKHRNPIETNKYYQEGRGLLGNYKTKTQREEMKNAPLTEDDDLPIGERKLHLPDGKYDNNVNLNESELAIKKLFETTIMSLAKTKQAIDYFGKGFMPAMSKGEDHDAVFWIKDFLKHFGIVEGASGKEEYNESLGDYYSDYIPDMPMTHMLSSAKGIKEIRQYKLKKPKETDSKYENNPELYEKDMKAYEEEQAKIKEIEEREHKLMLDRDWKAVMEEFILKANHFNAIQENKYALYMGESLLRKVGTYQTKYSSTGQLKKDKLRSDDESGEVSYIKKHDDKLQEQYRNWIRRLVFNQFKKEEGVLTNAMSRLQALTSTNYMTLNIRGGVANVTLGESTIIGEAFAKEFIGSKDWLKGKAIWSSSITSFIIGAYRKDSVTLADAVTKAFNVVDYSEIKGLPRKMDLAQASENIRDLAFSTLTAGEHFMQNGMLFSMMVSHRLVPNDDPNGPKYIIMSEKDFNEKIDKRAFDQIATDKQKDDYKKFKENLKKDPNLARKYAWWRGDVLYDFMRSEFTEAQQKEFITLRNKTRKENKTKFKEYPDLWSQMELKNGYMAFKADSDLAKMDIVREGHEISDAYEALGEFRSKVISVNKYIHGVYDKIGAAMLEREWYGAIVMQYHKHIPMGIARFYRRQGYFNEERGNVNKGIFASIKDFLLADFRSAKIKASLSGAEIDTAQSIQEMFKSSISALIHWQSKMAFLPEYEQANMRRSLGYILGMLSAVMTAIALKAMIGGGGDDKDEGRFYNFILYEADRLASEAWQFTPLGAISETKKLFSQPIAAQSLITDAFNAMGQISDYILYGDEDKMMFKSGRFAGESKLRVYIERRIPIWRNIKAIMDISKENHYYKRGANMLTYVPVDDISKWVAGK